MTTNLPAPPITRILRHVRVIALLADVLFLVVAMAFGGVDGNVRRAAGALVALVVVGNGFYRFGLRLVWSLMSPLHSPGKRRPTALVPGQCVAPAAPRSAAAHCRYRGNRIYCSAHRNGHRRDHVDITPSRRRARDRRRRVAIGGALLFAWPAAAQDADRLLLAAFCDLGNIEGSTCKKARLYPDAGTRACDVKLTQGALHRQIRRGHRRCSSSPMKAAASRTPPMAAARSCSNSSPTNMCSGVFSRARRPTTASTLPKSTQQDVLVCITGHIGQGYLESGVAQMIFNAECSTRTSDCPSTSC